MPRPAASFWRRTDFVESALWDERYGQDPAHRWLRSLLREVANSVDPRSGARTATSGS